MGLKGAAIGGAAGWIFGGPLGALFGSIIGHSIESGVRQQIAEEELRERQRASGYRTCGGFHSRNETVFCASAAALLAKLAKADGVVTSDEIRVVERAFIRLGFSKFARDYAINVFRKAKDDNHTIYEYAYNFANAVSSVQVRELLYELLWDVACADGRIDPAEMAILRQIPLSLGIRVGWFDYYARERIRGYAGQSSSRSGSQNRRQSSRDRFQYAPRDPLADAYELLGASPSDDAATLKKKYRDLAKKYHPDALRAQGLPDEMIGKANERMSKINAAWSDIKSARGL